MSGFRGPSNVQQWADVLSGLGRTALQKAGRSDEAQRGFPERWRGDDLGHRRPVDEAFFAWREACALNEQGGPNAGANAALPAMSAHPPRAIAAAVASPSVDAHDEDVLLWRALTNDRVDAMSVLNAGAADGAAGSRDRTDAGALFGQQRGRVPLEVWTERELSCVHALGWLASGRGAGSDRSGSLKPRLDAAMAWHIDNLQPDNATNHPWAVHLFLAWGLKAGEASATLYAEALLHNCQVNQGRPDAFSAHVLLDAADALRVIDATSE